VQLSYVVTPDGRAIDPIIINSSGGPEFEDEMRKVTESWRFEPSVTGAELPFNVSNTRFTEAVCTICSAHHEKPA